MCFLFMFFVWSDPVFTTGIFILKYYDQQVDHTLKSHSEKYYHLFTDYELFIIHYLLLNLQKQAAHSSHGNRTLCM